MKSSMIPILFFLASCSSSVDMPEENGNGELWIMVKIDSNFGKDQDLEIIDKITTIIENKKLGSLDGHSSGAHQLDFNFTEISNKATTKSEIIFSMNKFYPGVEYTVSTTFQVIYEKL